MSSVVETLSGVAGRLLGRPQDRRNGYVSCPEDGYWFRPAYTEGKCPLCGAVAADGAPPPPLLVRADRSWLGAAVLALESLGMLALVLVMYFRG